MVVDDKWVPATKRQIDGEIEALSRSLTGRVNELAGRWLSSPQNITPLKTDTCCCLFSVDSKSLYTDPLVRCGYANISLFI